MSILGPDTDRLVCVFCWWDELAGFWMLVVSFSEATFLELAPPAIDLESLLAITFFGATDSR